MSAGCLDRPRRATTEELAQQLVELEMTREVLRAELFGRMVEDGLARVDARGGHVVMVAPSEGMAVDQAAAREKLATLGALLRRLGQDPDDGLPMKPTTRRAGLRVNLR